MPPLTDPFSPEAPPAQTHEGKREVLLKNLLCNKSGVADIPLTTPTVASAELPFPQIDFDEISNAILRAGNTTAGKDEIPTAV
ncbi:hypothetical protein K3495_g17006, partial [Podosphaera aphanis]